MSPYEYMDLAQGSMANALTLLTFGFTILCGYLFLAYTIGEKLKQSQVIAITSISAVSYIFNLLGHLRAVSNAGDFQRLAGQISTETASSYNTSVIFMILIIRVSIFLVSLWFMWDVRHPKAE